MNEIIRQQLDFLTELDKMKQIFRRTPLIDGSRRENDAEHSWHLAVMLMVLKDYAAPDVDINHAIQMALVHDLVEIYAGDTYAYDEKGYEDKLSRETAAAEKLYAMLPHQQSKQFRALWEEFDACETPSSLYANAGDRLQPFINNYLTGGEPWSSNNITKSQALKRQEPVKHGMPALWEYVQNTINDAVAKGMLVDE